MPASLSYCGELTRLHDRNRYLCALFAPADIREAWFAIFAFHHEIAHIANTVSEEMVGFVRYAWWRETLTAVFAGKPPRGHPVAEALAGVVVKYALPSEMFEGIIDAHERALVEKQELDEAFLAATGGVVMELCARVAGKGNLKELGTALAAVEAANRKTMDAQHRGHFMALARDNLAKTGRLEPLFVPFLQVTRFYLKRLEKGRVSPSKFWLPFTLWRKSITG